MTAEHEAPRVVSATGGIAPEADRIFEPAGQRGTLRDLYIPVR